MAHCAPAGEARAACYVGAEREVAHATDTLALLERARRHLEWGRLEAAVLERCRGESARRRGLTPAEDADAARALLAQTDELMALLERGERLPLDALPDTHEHLARLSRQGALTASALAELVTMLRTARQVRAFLGSQRNTAKVTAASFAVDPTLDQLEELLAAALEPDGTLADRASPALRGLRTEIANLRERIVGRLQQLIERYTDVLSDRLYTVRDGRYVLPVRRDAHERVHGIVHGTSQSGSSVFVEPRAVVAQGNRLKMAESELEREQDRVLAALSEQAREHLSGLVAAAEALDALDQRYACARLGRDMRGSVSALCDEARVELRAARHPLLVLDGVAAVANDVAVDEAAGLVISGPNAAGKTVLLKTLGLAALGVRCGLPVAAAPGSRVGFFDEVLTDVGDEQSTEKNLSTFSAHVSNLVSVLGAARPRTLVLLDELATGTDPEQGAALACALVESLCERGAALCVTTHYEALKALSMRHPRLRAASVGFDVERMEPTFKLTQGVPGASSALLVARRYGIPPAILERAEQILPEHAREFERLRSELANAQAGLTRERAAVAAERAELTQVLEREKARLAELKHKGDAAIAREVERLQHEVNAARGDVERARIRLRAENAARQEVDDAERKLAQVAGRVALGGDLAVAAGAKAAPGRRDGRGVAEHQLKPGVRVHVPRLNSEAVVVEPPAKGRVRVAVGPMKLWVETEGLLAAPEEKAARLAPLAQGDTRAAAERGRDNTLDLRGMRVDDALSLVESFVDRMHTTDARVGYVLHGHGTGALRDAVRKHLKTVVRDVEDVRSAEHDDGGDAVTVFRLGAAY